MRSTALAICCAIALSSCATTRKGDGASTTPTKNAEKTKDVVDDPPKKASPSPCPDLGSAAEKKVISGPHSTVHPLCCPADPRYEGRPQACTFRLTDADMVIAVKNLVPKLLAGEWLKAFGRASAGAKPLLLRYPVRNRTSQHINTQRLMNLLERKILSSGKVKGVQSKERLRAAGFHKPGSLKEPPQRRPPSPKPPPADFALTGWVLGSADRRDGAEHRTYAITFEVVSIKTGAAVWSGSYRVVHQIIRPTYKW